MRCREAVTQYSLMLNSNAGSPVNSCNMRNHLLIRLKLRMILCYMLTIPKLSVQFLQYHRRSIPLDQHVHADSLDLGDKTGIPLYFHLYGDSMMHNAGMCLTFWQLVLEA